MTTAPIYDVLFLCYANSARSIMAEAILGEVGGGRFRAHSAGSHPAAAVDPYTLDLLRTLGHPTGHLRSKPWDDFAAPAAKPMDFVFTVCDDVAGESCPEWPGQPKTAHWGVPNPANATGAEAVRRLAHADAYRMLNRRIGLFVNLPLAMLDHVALKYHLAEIGALPRVA
ncbi:MAG: arsenate reductase ArsC [Bauldia sp.]